MVTDYATRFAIARPLREKTAIEVARFLVEEIFLKYGVPKEIITDQSLKFKNKLIITLCKFWNCKLGFSTPYHPQANGLAERTNRSLVQRLRKQRLGRDTK